jgi:hypothetical protein
MENRENREWWLRSCSFIIFQKAATQRLTTPAEEKENR